MGGDLGTEAISFIVSSLMAAIQMHVRMFKSVTRAKVYSLARLQELIIKALWNPISEIPTPLFPKMILPKVTSNSTTSINPSVHTLHSTKSTPLPRVSNSTPIHYLPDFFLHHLAQHLLKHSHHIFHLQKTLNQ